MLVQAAQPIITAVIVLKREEDQFPLFDFHMVGLDYDDLWRDAMEWMGIHANAQVRCGQRRWEEYFTDVMVCGNMPDGHPFCLPMRLNGTYADIIAEATELVSELFNELRSRTRVIPGVIDHTMLERARAQGEAILRAIFHH